MPAKSLPPNPSLEHLKYQARDLLNALIQGNPEAVARVREFHPTFARMSDDEMRASKLSLADAQLTVAREYGFPSWPKLKHHVEVLAQPPASIIGSLPGSKPPAGPVELKQKWPLGARIVREMELKQNMEIHTPIHPQATEHKLFLASQYAYNVVRELPAGGREVELEHLGFRMEFESGGYLWRYDSARSSSADQSSIAGLLKTIMSAKVRYFLDANNRVERMEGVDELVKRLNVLEGAKLKPGMTWDNKALDKVLNRLISGARQPLENIDSALRMMFNEDYFRTRIDSSFLPGKAVQPGDTWSFSREWLKHGRNLFNAGVMHDCTVTFHSWEMHGARLCARLEFQGIEKSRPQDQSRTGKIISLTTEGTFSGVVWFEPESGRGIEANSDRDFRVIWNNRGVTPPVPNPASTGPAPMPADHHHQVITEKLVSAG